MAGMDKMNQTLQKDSLIAHQALKIAILEKKVGRYKRIFDSIHNTIYCIGGPLNDNKLGFTRTQMSVFARISDLINEA
jgi:hypothetical protein